MRPHVHRDPLALWKLLTSGHLLEVIVLQRLLQHRAGCAFFAILAAETVIALTLHDGLIRPYGGDVLAVPLVYCGIRALSKVSSRSALVAACGIAVIVEIGQYLGVVFALDLAQNAFARTVLGTRFDWGDMLAYAVGAVFIVLGRTALRAQRRAILH